MSQTVTLTFEEGTSSKFYTLVLDGAVLTIQFGRIGSNGQIKEKTFKSEGEAKKEYDALLAEKKKKGYVEQGGSTEAAPAKAEKVEKAPKADKKTDEPAADAPAPKAAPKPAPPKGPSTPLPSPSLDDPPAEGLDLAYYRVAHVPVPERDPTPIETGDFVFEGYTISFGDGDEVFVSDAKGKRLKSIPDKVRKNDDYQALMRGRKDDRTRERRARSVLESRMIAGTELAGDEVGWLVDDEAFAPLLRGTIVLPAGGDPSRDAGLVVSWEEKRGLGLLGLDYDARWVGFPTLEILHPTKIGDTTAWQDLLVDLGLQQGIVQAFREVKAIPRAQRKLTESSILANRETNAASTMERVLMESGWTARRGTARRLFSLRTADAVVSFEARFDYGEFYMPSDPTTTGSLGFVDPETGRPVTFEVVPDVLVSEAIRSLEVCCAQAGAKKDKDDEDGEGDGDEGDDDDDDGDDD